MHTKPFGRAIALFVVSIASFALAGSWTVALATTEPGLGTALSFAAMGGSTVTNTGPSVIHGDLGVAPGTSVTGFPPGQVNGATHLTDAVALQAQDDLTTAYNSAAAEPPTQDLTGQDLGGMVLTPGVYRFSSSSQLTGPLTLDGQDSTNAVFIFQVGSTLTTASSSTVSLVNGAQGCNVWWQIESSATLGTGSTFRGNLMALTSITATTGANVPAGRLLARNGALTLDTNVISVPTDCATSAAPSVGPSASPSPSPPGTPGGGGATELIAAPPAGGGSTTGPGGPPPSVGGAPPPATGPPHASPSPRVPTAGLPPDVTTPNTGRALAGSMFLIVGLVLAGLSILVSGRRMPRPAL
ncbi:MAG: type secretion system secreted protein VgrG [Chloroflexota bacterium]|jgi:type VI secretion system secreted protein VgrG|nr:type secretion system secreted protein VgrG [Chloroflexota bacterium]